MPRHKPATAAYSHTRRAIASAAARLMAEHGIADYGMAKRKAARSLGLGEGEALPTNEEIELELRAWQSLYQEDEQRERLHDLRTTALEVMQTLAVFRPCLTGAALDSTAGRYSAIEIDLSPTAAKMSRSSCYRTASPTKPCLTEGQASILSCASNGTTCLC
jgi:hypothetical protein